MTKDSSQNLLEQGILCSSGSTIISADVVGYETVESSQLEKSFNDLAILFENGEVIMKVI